MSEILIMDMVINALVINIYNMKNKHCMTLQCSILMY